MPEAELHSPAPPPPNPNSALFVLKAPAPAPPPPPAAVKSESPSPPPPNGGGRGGFGPLLWLQSHRPKIRVTTEYDSDSTSFQHRISCRLLDSLAKVKLSFQNNGKGEISEPQVDLTSKYLSLHYDVEDQNAIVKANFDVTPGLQLEAVHDVKFDQLGYCTTVMHLCVLCDLTDAAVPLPALIDFRFTFGIMKLNAYTMELFVTIFNSQLQSHVSQQGQVVMVADLAGPAYKFELSSSVPAIGMPRASFKFPYGEISLEQKEEEEEDVKKVFSINGILKGHILNGICSARFKDEDLNLRYCFKDEQMAFIPSISLPSNAVSFAFKRRFGPSDKLSYWYNFDSNDWSAVYKHTAGKDYKFKAGYDSEVRLGWASLWVGDEDGAAKTAPMKMKVQFMLQVPQDDIKSSNLMFRVKKRWDL
nr:outer envelope pore protein 37, chloroplastic [Ipomoea batatas]